MQSVANIDSQPNLAVLQSFFNKFATMLGMKPLSFERLRTMLDECSSEGRVDNGLIELHVKLMRFVGLKSANSGKWLVFLTKFCSFDPNLSNELLQLERFGYEHSPIETKLNVLKALCEKQFDFNPKFKELVNQTQSGADLRLLPIGHDSAGLTYYYQQDADANVRVYTEEPDDQVGGTWQLRVSTRGQIDELITLLESGKSPLDEQYADLIDSAENSQDATDVKMQVKQESEAVEQSTSESKREEESSKVLETPEKDVKPAKVEEVSKSGQSSPAKELAQSEDQQPLVVKDKFGTFCDLFQATVPEKKPKKESAGAGSAPVRQAKGGRKEELKRENASQSAGSNNASDAETTELERRLNPRRSTRNDTPTRVTVSKAKKDKPKKEVSIEESEPSHAGSDNDTQDESDEDEAEVDTSDSEFIPLAALRKRLSSSRVRRARRGSSVEESDESTEEGDADAKRERKQANEETLCKRCDNSDHWEALLLCDDCDDAWHTWCLRPPLWYVPDGDWYCPPCQQKRLVVRLKSILPQLDALLLKKAAEEKKRKQAQERMRRELQYIGASLKSILPGSLPDEKSEEEEPSDSEEERSRRRRREKKKRARMEAAIPIALSRQRRAHRQIDYNFRDYDEMIEGAVDDLQEAPVKKARIDPHAPSGGLGKGKNMANILRHIRSESKEGSGASTPKSSGVEPNGRRVKPKQYSDDDTEEESDEEVNKKENAGEEEQPQRAGGEVNDENEPPTSNVGQPPSAILLKKTKKRLGDLDVDNFSESEHSEFKPSDDEEFAPDEEESDDNSSDSEYSEEFARRRATRRSARIRQKDRDFVVSDSDPDYEEPRRSRVFNIQTSPTIRPAETRGRGGRRKSYSDESSEDSIIARAKRKRSKYVYSDDSEESYSPRKKRSTRRSTQKSKKKKPPRRGRNRRCVEESEESEEEQQEEEPAERPKRSTQKKRIVSDDDEEEQKEEFEDDNKKKSTKPSVSSSIPNLVRRSTNCIESDDSGEEQLQKNEFANEKPSDNSSSNGNVKSEERMKKPQEQTKKQCASRSSTSTHEAPMSGYSVNGLLKNDDNATPVSSSVIRPTPTLVKPVAMAPTAPVGSAFSHVRKTSTSTLPPQQMLSPVTTMHAPPVQVMQAPMPVPYMAPTYQYMPTPGPMPVMPQSAVPPGVVPLTVAPPSQNAPPGSSLGSVLSSAMHHDDITQL